MQRILHIIGKMDRAGAETMLMNLYRNIDREKIQFDFIVFTRNKGDYDDEIISLGGRIIPLIGSNSLHRMSLLRKFLINHREYNVVHAHTLLSNAFHIYAAKKAAVPIRISHSHNTLDKSSNSFIGKIYKTLSKIIIKKYSTKLVACGNLARDFLFDKETNVLILPNSVDSKYFGNIGIEKRNYLNQEFSLDNSYLKLIQIGRLQQVKNHKFSIRVAGILRDKNVKFKMFFVGQGEQLEEIKTDIKEAELDDYIMVTGVRKDVAEMMAGADVMIMPSLYEGFPVVLVESQAVGVPTIISDNISTEVDLEVGLIDFLPLDENLWVDKIIGISRPVDTLGERLSTIYRKGFDINSSVEIVEKMYSSFSKNV